MWVLYCFWNFTQISSPDKLSYSVSWIAFCLSAMWIFSMPSGIKNSSDCRKVFKIWFLFAFWYFSSYLFSFICLCFLLLNYQLDFLALEYFCLLVKFIFQIFVVTSFVFLIKFFILPPQIYFWIFKKHLFAVKNVFYFHIFFIMTHRLCKWAWL